MCRFCVVYPESTLLYLRREFIENDTFQAKTNSIMITTGRQVANCIKNGQYHLILCNGYWPELHCFIYRFRFVFHTSTFVCHFDFCKKIQNKSLGINVLSAISCCDKRRGLSQLRRDLFHPRVKHLNQGMSCGSVKVGRLKPPPVLTAPVNYSQKWSILVDWKF